MAENGQLDTFSNVDGPHETIKKYREWLADGGLEPFGGYVEWRVFAVGRLLRRLSLDELPQLISVLKGDMSLIGPRARLPQEPDDRRRIEKPGLTGLWQVTASDNKYDIAEIDRLDDEYSSKWSIGLDLKIVCVTIARVFTRRRHAPGQ